jgi:hypothetical protein
MSPPKRDESLTKEQGLRLPGGVSKALWSDDGPNDSRQFEVDLQLKAFFRLWVPESFWDVFKGDKPEPSASLEEVEKCSSTSLKDNKEDSSQCEASVWFNSVIKSICFNFVLFRQVWEITTLITFEAESWKKNKKFRQNNQPGKGCRLVVSVVKRNLLKLACQNDCLKAQVCRTNAEERKRNKARVRKVVRSRSQRGPRIRAQESLTLSALAVS